MEFEDENEKEYYESLEARVKMLEGKSKKLSKEVQGPEDDDVKNWEITQMKKVNSSELFDEINKNIIEIEEDNFYVYFNINPQIEEDKKEDSFLSKIFCSEISFSNVEIFPGKVSNSYCNL